MGEISERWQVEIHDSLQKIDKNDWNGLQLNGNPFVRFEFLFALEQTGCLGNATGWFPRYVLVFDCDDENEGENAGASDNKTKDNETTAPEGTYPAKQSKQLIAACATYVKTNSYGEFVFDWAWADAYERTGQAYYPKLVGAIPFTPATGPRLLVKAGQPETILQRVLAESALAYCEQEGFSSMHWLFVTESESNLLTDTRFLSRIDCQYHWQNDNYASFDEFLTRCTSKRRKTIRRERRYVSDANLRLERRSGSSLSEHEWELVHNFYCATFDRKWGNPSLTLEFFLQIGAQFGDNCLIVFAYSTAQDPIAVSVMFHGEDTLYGRYWGATENHHCLHFEACYYQGIEFAIERQLARFEPGAQGEHKITRGFEPVFTYSAHWLADERFSAAVERYLAEERPLIRERQQGLEGLLPFRVDTEINADIKG